MKPVVKYYGLLVIACLLIYFPSLWNDFQMDWDDQWQLMNRYTEDGFTQENLQAVFTDYYYGQYSPVNEVIYMAIYAAFGYTPAVFHLYSLLLHLANCCLLFAFLRRMAAVFYSRSLQHNPSVSAFATTLLFVIHPLQVESICWISASKIPLYAFFVLLALLAYLRYSDTRKIRFYFMSLALFVFAFGSKEQAIVLPATLLLVDWALARYRKPDSSGNNWPGLLLEKLPFILFAIFAALQTRSHQSMEYTEQVAGYPFWQRLVFACYSLAAYAGRFVLPVNLLYIYPFPMAPGGEMPLHYLAYPVVVATAIFLLCINIRKIPRPVVFGLLFFLINMALMLHIVPMSRFMVTADRYVYLASAGLFFIAAWYAVPWLQKMAASGKKWIPAATVCYLLYLGSYAHIRTYTWKDSDTIKKGFRELLHDDTSAQKQKSGDPPNAPEK
jgi:hypothetical protein